METTTTTSVYVGTYGKYNNGSIAGAWVDLSQFTDASEFYAHIKELHKNEQDPEYMYQDFEGFPESEYSESGMNIERLIEYANLDDEQREIVDAYIDATGYRFSDIEFDEVQEKVVFQEDPSDFSSLATQYGYHMAEETGEIPEHLSAYIDYEAYGQSWLDGYMEGNGYVFSN